MGGFYLNSENDYNCLIDGTSVQVVTGNKNEWVGGHTLTLVKGEKKFHISGTLEEMFVGGKIEIIVPWEIKWVVGNTTDLHVGGSFEMIVALTFEINKAWTIHVGIPGQKTFITNSKLESLEDELLVTQYKQKIGTDYEKLTKRLETIKSLTQTMKSLTEQGDTLGRILANWWLRTSHMVIKCTDFKLTLSGTSKYDVNEIRASAKGSFLLKGSNVKIDGGGGKLSVGGGVSANTTSLTA